MSRFMVVGALGVETLPLVRRLEVPRPLSRRLVVGRIGAHEVGVLTVGVGLDKASRRTEAGLARWRPQHVISAGTCGGLVDGVEQGALFCVGRVGRDGESGTAVEALDGSAGVALVSVAEAVWTASRRQQLAASGWQVVDMEAAAVAEQARAAGLAFGAVKIVSDLAGAEEDVIIGPPDRPDPRRIARFKARALRLCEGSLAPWLVRTVWQAQASG